MKRSVALILLVFLAIALGRAVYASTSVGTINSSYKYAWGDKLGWINFKPTNGGITITDTVVTGYAWSSVGGWINFSPTNGGVTNNCTGVLGGTAWSSTKGWIDMTGGTINSSGVFKGVSGVAASSTGRINFECTNCDVRTDWIPCASRSTTASETVTTSETVTSSEEDSGSPAMTMSNPEETAAFEEALLNQVIEQFFEMIAEKADVTGDGEVNISDFQTLVSNLGISGGSGGSVGDLDGDGKVDLRDVNLLMVTWGQ